MQFPQYIYLNKKGLQLRVILYGIICLFFLWAFWKGSGEFFTKDYYDPEMFLLMPVCFIIILFMLIKELMKLKNTEPLVILSNEGVQFTDKYFSEFGIVKWEDITSCYDDNYGRCSEPCIHIQVSDNETYITKIKERKTRDAFRKLSNNKNGSLLWAEIRLLNCDVMEFKKVIFKHIKK